MYHENKKRSIVKTISWRFLATLTTAIIVYMFTGQLILALSVGSIEVLAKIVLYFFHERMWNKINYGRRSIEPFAVWVTGPPSEMKSRVVDQSEKFFKKNRLPCEVFDEATLSGLLQVKASTEDSVRTLPEQAANLGSLLEKNNVIVILSFDLPDAATRDRVVKLFRRYVEIDVRDSTSERPAYFQPRQTVITDKEAEPAVMKKIRKTLNTMLV